MARARKRRPEPVEDDDDEDDENINDYVKARLASALASLEASKSAVLEALALFNNPDDDDKGKERKELVDTALEAAGCATRALEAAEEVVEDCDFTEPEPWDEGDDEDDD